MMLHKAVEVENNKWVYGVYIKTKDENYILQPANDSTAINAIDVYPETVCTSTTLKDKNKNTIYENDILDDKYIVKFIDFEVEISGGKCAFGCCGFVAIDKDRKTEVIYGLTSKKPKNKSPYSQAIYANLSSITGNTKSVVKK